MKHLILSSLLLFSVTAQLFGQELFVNQVSLQEIEVEYIEATIVYRIRGGGGYHTQIDYGQSCEGSGSRTPCMHLTNEAAERAVFLSQIEAINAIAENGWELTAILDREDERTQFFFRKKSSTTN